MKNGSLLEKTLYIVQESLKDKDDTSIYCNHKLLNTDGRPREFDVVIKSKINNFDITAVIECKDYKGKVTVEKIEAFNSKCLRHPEINKKIFVSRSGYQADAYNAAKAFGIELYDIEDIDLALNSYWFAIKYIIPIERSFQLHKISFYINPQFTFELSKFSIVNKNTHESQGIINYIIEQLKNSHALKTPIYLEPVGLDVNNSSKFSFTLTELDDYFLCESGNDKNRFDLLKIDGIFELIEETACFTTKIERIKSENKDMSIIVTHSCKNGDDVKLVLKNGDHKKFDMFIVNRNTGEITDLDLTFEYVNLKQTN